MLYRFCYFIDDCIGWVSLLSYDILDCDNTESLVCFYIGVLVAEAVRRRMVGGGRTRMRWYRRSRRLVPRAATG